MYGPELRQIAKVTVSHCCICGYELADSKSQELGIGPKCRKTYMKDPQVALDDKGWARALGVLAQSGLPGHIVDGVLARQPNAHKAANLVAFWASANIADKATVLTCANILRFLGYVKMAERLESDRSEVKLTVEGDTILVKCKRNDDLNRGIYKVGGRIVRHDSGRFKAWGVPVANKANLMILLGVAFGGFRVFDNGTTSVIDHKTWADFYAAVKPTKAAPAASTAPNPGVYLTDKGRYFHLETPYNPGFVSAIRAIRSRRYEGGNVNSFATKDKAQVIALVQSHYGVAL